MTSKLVMIEENSPIEDTEDAPAGADLFREDSYYIEDEDLRKTKSEMPNIDRTVSSPRAQFRMAPLNAPRPMNLGAPADYSPHASTMQQLHLHEEAKHGSRDNNIDSSGSPSTQNKFWDQTPNDAQRSVDMSMYSEDGMGESKRGSRGSKNNNLGRKKLDGTSKSNASRLASNLFLYEEDSFYETLHEVLVYIVQASGQPHDVAGENGSRQYIYMAKLKPHLQKEWDPTFEEKHWGFKKLKHLVQEVLERRSAGDKASGREGTPLLEMCRPEGKSDQLLVLDTAQMNGHQLAKPASLEEILQSRGAPVRGPNVSDGNDKEMIKHLQKENALLKQQIRLLQNSQASMNETIKMYGNQLRQLGQNPAGNYHLDEHSSYQEFSQMGSGMGTMNYNAGSPQNGPMYPGSSGGDFGGNFNNAIYHAGALQQNGGFFVPIDLNKLPPPNTKGVRFAPGSGSYEQPMPFVQ